MFYRYLIDSIKEINTLRELRLIEVLEELCEKILKYNVHAERDGSLRYAKGESQTMGTLKGLRFENFRTYFYIYLRVKNILYIIGIEELKSNLEYHMIYGTLHRLKSLN